MDQLVGSRVNFIDQKSRFAVTSLDSILNLLAFAFQLRESGRDDIVL